MRRLHVLVLVGLGASAALAFALLSMPQSDRAKRSIAPIEAATKHGQANSSAPPTDDPEVLAAWFQQEVTGYLERGKGSRRTRGAQGTAAAADADRVGYVELANAGETRTDRAELTFVHPRELDGREVDWDYVQDVFAGRVTGIPNESKAGLSLQEMDKLGDIPYVETLREEGRYEELRDLGFDRETTPWPACLRKGRCRLDRISSPP